MIIYQVGASIHGDLLSPRDIDMAINLEGDENAFKTLSSILLPFKSSEYSIQMGEQNNVAVFRKGKINYIIFLNQDLKKYIDTFDMDILKGYGDLKSNRIVLYREAELALENKTITQLVRGELAQKYFGKDDDFLIERRANYYKYSKLPEGWEFKQTDKVAAIYDITKGVK